MNISQKWMQKYELLKEYKEEYGNIDVPKSYQKDGIKLGIWLCTQRQAYKDHGSSRITQDQIQLLEELGMKWQINNKFSWSYYYQLLKEYKEEYGNIDVPQSYQKDGIKLGYWLWNQKQLYKGKRKGKISEDQIQLLEELGINWQIRNVIWEDYYELLKQYQEEHGNIDVPIDYQINQINLGMWLSRQKHAYKEQETGRITQDQIQLLEELGINWQIHNTTWKDYYELLKQYQEEHGNIDVPFSYEKNGIKLGKWLSDQRQLYKGKRKGKISEDQIQLLEELGIKWKIRTTTWKDYYELLKQYQEEHGNIDVPFSYEKNGIKLGIWLVNQRQAYIRQGTCIITQDQIQLLEELGIKWKIRTTTWKDYYELLKQYQEEHGNIDVPCSYEKNGIKLGKWLAARRYAYIGKGTARITQDQIRLLNELNMDWNIKDTKFLQKAIDNQIQEKYQQVLLERVNHIIEDLVNEGINDIDATNQKEIEKVMVKRIWR